MKRKNFKCSLLASIGMLFAVSGLSGCTGDGFTAATVRLQQTSLEMSVGDSQKLNLSASKGYENFEPMWFTSDKNVAYADGGYVYAVGEGEAIITVVFGGGKAECKVTVGEGAGSTVPTIALSKTKLSITVGSSAKFEVTRVYPEDTEVSFENSDTSVCEMTSEGWEVTVKALAVGTAQITVSGTNNIKRACNITVVEGGGDVPAEGDDIAVDKNLNYSGELKIGSPKLQRTFMEGLLQEFNTYTGSNIKFTVIDFEESTGTSGFNSAESMPAVFPYASDQVMDLSEFDALSKLPNSDIKWIKNNMGDAAVTAATYGSVVGYPFAADNGLVMFYQKSVAEEKGIDFNNITIRDLLALADDMGYEVNYPLNDGFYCAPALMTYSPNHESLYTLSKSGSTYKSTSKFNQDIGVQGARLIREIATHPSIRTATSSPRQDVLATITDSSKVRDFKSQMGDNYAVAPLPWVDEAHTTRIGSFLGYKFYGVNMKLNETDKNMAFAVAKFLCSKHVQTKRFNTYRVRPTLTSLAELARSEQHVVALEEQTGTGSIALKAVSLALWSQAMSAYTSIKALSASATDQQYKDILAVMDGELNK